MGSASFMSGKLWRGQLMKIKLSSRYFIDLDADEHRRARRKLEKDENHLNCNLKSGLPHIAPFFGSSSFFRRFIRVQFLKQSGGKNEPPNLICSSYNQFMNTLPP